MNLWRRETPIYVVSGLPRSGTSLMMQMLEAGGVPVLVDAERPADESNPRGYYEYAPVKRIYAGDAAWLRGARGKAVKVVSALLSALPAIHTYRVIFMQRPLDEVLRSQRAMLTRLNRATAESDDKMLEDTERHLWAIDQWLTTQRGVSALHVGYHDVLADPRAQAEAVAKFLGLQLDIDAMVKVVDPALHRERGES